MNRYLQLALLTVGALLAVAAVVAVLRPDRQAAVVTQQPEPTQPAPVQQPTLAPTQPPAVPTQTVPPPTVAPPTATPPRPTSVPPTPTPPRPTAAPPTATPPRPTAAPPTATARPRIAYGLSEQTSRNFRKQEYVQYVPKSYDGSTQYKLLVVIHGNGRHVEEYAEMFTRFADEQRYIILAPYFPDDVRFQQLGIGEDEKVIRSDERVLGLVDEISGRFNIDRDRFDLFGFSAGGQFAHRFLYLHPERLRSVVVASPGTITVPQDRYDWPHGFGDLDKLAKARVDLDRVRQVRVMLTVGTDDVDDDSLRETDATNRFGKTRIARARTLHAAWDSAKISHQYLEIKGLDHELDERIVKPATQFLAQR